MFFVYHPTELYREVNASTLTAALTSGFHDLDIETEVHHVAIFYDVFLSFNTKFTSLFQTFF